MISVNFLRRKVFPSLSNPFSLSCINVDANGTGKSIKKINFSAKFQFVVKCCLNNSFSERHVFLRRKLSPKPARLLNYIISARTPFSRRTEDAGKNLQSLKSDFLHHHLGDKNYNSDQMRRASMGPSLRNSFGSNANE